MKRLNCSRRFVLLACMALPAAPLIVSVCEDGKRSSILKILAANVWTWRMFRGLTPESLADKCGYATELQLEIEKGAHNITLGRLEHLADGLDTSMHELVRDTARGNRKRSA